MVKETVKMLDGTSQDVDIKRVGTLTSNILIDKYIKVNEVTSKGDGTQTIDLKGSSLFLLQNAFLEKGVSGVDLDQIDPEDFKRIYDKYFANMVNMAMGTLGGNPKS